MVLQTIETIDPAFITSFAEKTAEPSWLTDLRIKAWGKAEEMDLPYVDKTKIKRWNFTKFSQYESFGKTAYGTNLPEAVTDVVDVNDAEMSVYIQQDQTPLHLHLSQEAIDKGVIIKDLATALKENSELVKEYFMTTAVKFDENRLTAFHAALVNGGLFIYVPKNVELESPIQAVFVQKDDRKPFINHVIIVADESSKLTYVENYVGQTGKGRAIANIVSEVIAKDNATVTYGAVDTLGVNVTTYLNRRGHVLRDASLDWALGVMNNGNTVINHLTNLVGNNSSSDVKTVTVGTGKQTQNFTTEIRQYGLASVGMILKHGVVLDSSTSIFNGIGHIMHNAKGADAQQESRVLMLSDLARGDANPILLIDEDEVTAGHAASVGRVDPEALFYLQSRGLSLYEAERLVIHGFLNPVVDQLPIKRVRELLSNVIEGKVKR
ncbi:Fe-S cluster assembly protein SufD [Brochothrix thermosphacta]|uniref:Fe-S cluster assembly protein SufD n=1 Tax=Brochothrix thermosphacta TaxID=2756 RepID=UPI000D795D80|nr:Fe-S cluster assembly protein SufD [Brochothrix thermosphacta]SPN75730.1 FeS assembly protein SufD [Brochothrix thermosphacta]